MENQLVIAPKTDLFFDIQIFEHIQRVAKVFATSTMVPVQFQNNIGNCIIALNLAARFKSDPFMVMQNMYVVHGRPGIEAKLVIALINATGRFTPLQYKYEGEKDNRSCYAYATKKADNELLEGPKVSIQMAKAEGWWSKKDKHGNETSKWQSLPELMLAYRAAVFFARLYCPEVTLGMQTREELQDVYDAEFTQKVTPVSSPALPESVVIPTDEDLKEIANQEEKTELKPEPKTEEKPKVKEKVKEKAKPTSTFAVILAKIDEAEENFPGMKEKAMKELKIDHIITEEAGEKVLSKINELVDGGKF